MNTQTAHDGQPIGSEKIINKIAKKMHDKEPFFSLEYFPPKTNAGAVNLFARFDRMASYEPLFLDVTWSAGGGNKKRGKRTLDIVRQSQDFCCHTTNMHLTCNIYTKEEIIDILETAKNNGITNILALSGDAPDDEDNIERDFNHAVDLVRLIKQEYGDYFCVSVAGYPYGHPDCESYEKDIEYLKQKVDAGADFVISQLFFYYQDFLKFTSDCRDAGIECPILPGILPIQGYRSLRNITKMCSVPVPQEIIDAIEPIKDDDQAIKQYGVNFAVDMCRHLLDAGVPGLHFYTLNREVVTSRIIEELSLGSDDACGRPLPWRKAVVGKRGKKESVRPIYWANRSKSYLSRTESWDDFPNGRWGDNRSPAFGELTDYHVFLHQKKEKPSMLRKKWGQTLEGPEDITQVFANFIDGKVDQLPWIENGLSLESNLIHQQLLSLNLAGFWTINSQPRVNAAPSNDPAIGWGGDGGIVYQKEYLEFFCSPSHFEWFESEVSKYGNRFSYQASTVNGDIVGNVTEAIAVTWGVFPGKQIQQPTVVDPTSFKYWKDEAFELWKAKWGRIYPKDSESRELINTIHDNYYLVNIVDNDFLNGNIFNIFTEYSLVESPRETPILNE
eukprot:TRINITY_DN10723_c0_g1_i1.p1 TRINITY_DN10723_c0_g1~~TRINITY_DN10723_c0_g1_i1.p1  ORF type:complete len:615 (-),score=162.45 TRINITY_DN10723_c0_g1_i1:33-1877(-)